MFGLFTRPVAFILSGQMAAAYFMAHFPQGVWPLLNGGELAALYSFVFLFLAVGGGGDFSIDGVLRREGR
ncbi:MAG: DoxX family protein [Candidatus Methylomirabilales bacterium]